MNTPEKKKRTPKPAMTGDVRYILLSFPFWGEFSSSEVYENFIQSFYFCKQENELDKVSDNYLRLKKCAAMLANIAVDTKYRLVFSDKINNDAIYDYVIDTDPNNIEGYVASCLLRSFAGSDPIGPYYIGVCSRCGKIFAKKHVNAVFCGVNCASAERMARWREK